MVMLTLNGIVQNVFDTPEDTDRETGEVRLAAIPPMNNSFIEEPTAKPPLLPTATGAAKKLNLDRHPL